MKVHFRLSRVFLVAVVICSVGLSSAQSTGPNPPEGFRALFNGKNLDGWHGNNPHTTVRAKTSRAEAIAGQQEEFKAHWSIENRELVNDGHGPYATTDAEFGDIELRIEYKTVAKADSGIYLRGTPQVQIWDTTEAGGKWGGSLNAEQGSGGLFNNSKGAPGKSPLVLADQPFGEWNSLRIVQIGARTTVHLNYRLVVDNAIMENYWDKTRRSPLPAKGPIHLQTHGGEIRWRNIFLREIGTDEANRRLRGDDKALGFKSVFNGKDFNGWDGATGGYEVRAGAMVCKADKGGVLFTKEQYGDFVVRLEFKLPEGGNNGLAIRYPGEGRPAYDGMCEIQIADDAKQAANKKDPRQFNGAAYGMAPSQSGYLRPIGEWNYQETTVKGSTVKVELNGSVILNADLSAVNEYLDGRPHPGKNRERGHFGFAGHRSPVMFRNVAIKKLD